MSSNDTVGDKVKPLLAGTDWPPRLASVQV